MSYQNKLDLSRPVKTRSGTKARIICSNVKSDTPIVAILEFNDKELVQCYDHLGRCSGVGHVHYDLINVPQITNKYQVVYQDRTSDSMNLPLDYRLISGNSIGVIERTYENDEFKSCKFIPIDELKDLINYD